MSQEFNRPAEQQPLPSNPTPPPRRNNTWIYVTIIAVLLLTNILLFVNRNKVVEQRDDAEIQFATSDSSRRAVETEYNAALTRLDELVSKNAQMDSLLSDRDSEVARLKRQIDAIVRDKNASAADLGRAKRLIASLNAKVKGYEERIAELEEANVELTTANLSLEKERDSAVTENVGLQEKVKLGAVLHASNIRMQPIDLKRGGRKIKETEKASKTDVLRINFDIDENRVAENGVKDLYLRITGPSGNLLSNAAYGSGVSTTYDGQTLNYTLAKQVNLKQGEPLSNVIVDWNQESSYESGDYKIEIYNEGYKIGGGSVHLK